MSETAILYEKQGKISLITLNRPHTINAFNYAMTDQLNEALDRFAADNDAWVAIIQGAGPKGFSSGADLKGLKRDSVTGEEIPLAPITICEGMVTPKPILAAVHGYCIGEGLLLALACDMLFATVDSRFYIPEARVGVNAVDIPLQLARKMGYNRAFEFMMGLAPAAATWCHEAGLVNQLVEGDATAAARQWANQLIDETAPLAVRGMKEALWQATYTDAGAGREAGQSWRQKIIASADWQEGLAAFRAKRKPQFRGA